MSTETTTGVNPVSTTFPRRPDGSVDWLAVAFQCPEHFYVKKEHSETVAKLLGKPVDAIRDLGPEDIAKVPDRYLVIRKAGVLRLGRLRGYSSVLPDVKHVQRDYVVVQTWIDWLPFENEPAKRTGGVGEANPENTTRLGAAYLAATAQNRAYARGVRDYLEIDIVSSDELGGPEQEPYRNDTSSASGSAGGSSTSAPVTDLGPSGTLQRAAQSGGFSFDQVKQAAVTRWVEDSAAIAKAEADKTDAPIRRIENDPTDWATWSDVPPRDCLTLVQLIKAAEAAKAAKVKAAAEGATPASAAAKRPATTAAKAKVTPISAASAPQRVAA